MIFKEKKDCEVSPLELKDFCYTKSKELFNKIKANKNFCIDRDECSISFENLREPSAVNNPQDKIEEIDISNNAVEIYCVSPDGNRDNGLINDISFRDYVTGNGKSTVSAGTVKIHLSLINASKKQRDKAVAEAQKQVDLLAKNIATLSLSCEIPNATVTAHCYQNKDAVLGLPIGEFNKERSSKDNFDDQVVITNDFKNYSTVTEGTLTSYVSVIDVVEDLGKFKKNKDYFKFLSETYYAEYSDKGIQNFKKRYDELTETALLNAYLNLDCYYGNKEQTINCVTSVKDSILDAEDKKDKTISFDVYSGKGYSTSATISESYFTKRLNYSPIVSQYRANSENADAQSPGDIEFYINDTLSAPTGEFNFNNQITEPLKELRQNYLLTNLNCYYGNLKVTLNCGNPKSPYTQEGSIYFSKFNKVLVPEVKGYVNLVNPVTITGNNYLNKATFELDDIFSDEANQEAAKANLEEAARQAFRSSMEQAYNAAAFTLDRCGYYNHTMYVYCDKGVSENDTYKNGETAPSITNEWANTAYNGDESREWTAQYNFDKFELRDDQIKVLIKYDKFLEYLNSMDESSSLFSFLQSTGVTDDKDYGTKFNAIADDPENEFNELLKINGVPYDFDYPHVIFFIYFNDYTKVKVELPANSCNKVPGVLESTTTCTNTIDVPYKTDCLDGTEYISEAANCPVIDYDSELTTELESKHYTNAEIDVTVDNTEFTIPKDSIVTCSSYPDEQNSTCDCEYTYYDEQEQKEKTLTITDCSKISESIETIMKDLDSGLRLANKSASVLYNVVNYGTLNSLSYSGIVSQAQADIEALNYLLPSISCIYGNIPLRALRCLPCSCYAQRGLSSYGMQNCAPNIGMHKYLADTPEGADNLAITLRTAMRNCSCKETGVECTYDTVGFTIDSCGANQGFTLTLCTPGNVELDPNPPKDSN